MQPVSFNPLNARLEHRTFIVVISRMGKLSFRGFEQLFKMPEVLRHGTRDFAPNYYLSADLSIQKTVVTRLLSVTNPFPYGSSSLPCEGKRWEC